MWQSDVLLLHKIHSPLNNIIISNSIESGIYVHASFTPKMRNKERLSVLQLSDRHIFVPRAFCWNMLPKEKWNMLCWALKKRRMRCAGMWHIRAGNPYEILVRKSKWIYSFRGICERIILEWMLCKNLMMLWTWFTWPRIGTIGWLLWT
jgi:hypothetical protein